MKNYVVALLIIITGFSCQKEISHEPGAVPASLTELFMENRNILQETTIDGVNGGTYQGKLGGKFYFNANSFVDPDGNPVTGTVNLEIKEIYTPGDMILNNIPSMSDGKPLESGGEFFIRATSGGKELKLAPGKYVQISLPGDDMAGMQVFNGRVTEDTTNWVLNNSGLNRVQLDTISSGGVYNLFCDSIQWINCDRFINDPKISCEFDPGNCPDADSTHVYVHFTGRNSVVNVYNYTTKTFQSDNLIAAPVTIVGICAVNGKIYSSLTTANLSGNSTYTLNYTPTTKDALEKSLKQLQ